MKNSLEILVAAMNQVDYSLIDRMNISSNVVIANQCDKNSIDETEINGHLIKIISTKTRGVGLNRNLALNFSSGDILLFADEDMIYASDAEEKVIKAFQELPRADVILFGTNFSKNDKIYKSRCPNTGKLSWYKSLKYGTYAIAIKRKAVLRHNLHFTELFGGGCIYSHGEDSDFILQCYRKKLKIYSYSYILGTTLKDFSTCFEGYNEKYFYDMGALAKSSFKKIAPLYIFYMSFRLKNKTKLKYFQRMHYLICGYKSYKDLVAYQDSHCDES